MTPTRHIALVGPPTRIRRLAAEISRPGSFVLTYEARGLVVLANPEAQYVELGLHGVLVGTLFSRDDPPRRVRRLNRERGASVRASAGAELIVGYWGGYVAFVEGKAEGEWEVLRDPSATMPCYYAEADGVTVFGSDADALTGSGVASPLIDWTYVAGHLRAAELPSARTGLAGITELAGGTAMTCSGERRSLRICWSPWDHVRPPKAAEGVLAARLQATVQGCVRAWATCFDGVLAGVSGGLDSSIVAACLADRSGSSCYTLATRDPDGDERDFARLLAAALQLPLAEAFYRLDDVDLGRSNAAHLPRPVGLPWLQASEAAALRIASQRGAGAIFDGNGGDNVFCYLSSAAPVADRLLAEGPVPGVWRTVQDLCRLHRASVPAVLARAARKALSPRSPYRWRPNGRFLAPGPDPGPELTHAWLEAPASVLPGKRAHVAMILAVYNYLEGFPRRTGPVALSPLMSQPIVELCLGIPTWLWFAGGRNRAVARSAFADLLPGRIIERRSKGGPDGFLIEILDAKRDELRSMLLDGLLARHDLIDRAAVEAALDDEGPARGTDYVRLLAIADAEAWARGWASRSPVGRRG